MARLLSRAVALKNMFCAFCVFPVGLLSTQCKIQPVSATQTLDVPSHVHQAVKNLQGATHDF